MPEFELQPMTVGEILSTAAQIYWHRFWLMFRLVGLFILPIEIVYAVLISTGSASRANVISELLVVATGQLAAAACMKAVTDEYLGHFATWRSSVKFVWHRGAQVCLVAIVQVVIVGAGLLLLFVPGIYLLIALLLTTPALLLENLRPLTSLQRSRTLIQGTWLRTAGCYLLASILVFFVALIPTLLLIHATGSGTTSSTSHPLAAEVASVITSLLTTPFMAMVIVFIYYDLRVRKEGLTVDQLARAVHIDPSSVDRSRFQQPEADA
jgi:hypothetical protein